MERLDGYETVVLSLSRDELVLLAGSINEAINAVEDWEFSTRLGAEKSDARALRSELGRIISNLPPE